jgi:hypothetical protein
MDFQGDNELADIVVSHTGQAYFVLYPDRRQQGVHMTGFSFFPVSLKWSKLLYPVIFFTFA